MLEGIQHYSIEKQPEQTWENLLSPIGFFNARELSGVHPDGSFLTGIEQ
jgi:hypothetical protein